MKRFFWFWLLAGVLLVRSVIAHTAYVLTRDELAAAVRGQGTMTATLTSLTTGEIIAIVAGFIVLAALAGYLFYIRLHHQRVRAFFDSLGAHHTSVPAILRVILGVTLVIGGLGNDYLFAPDLPLFSLALSNLEAVVGVMLVFGFLTELAAIFAILLFAYGASIHGAVVLNHLEILGTSLFLLAWGGGRFSVNHAESAWMRWHTRLRAWLDSIKPYGVALLRWSVGLSFIWMGLNEKLLNPSLSLAVVEKFGLAAQLGVRPDFYVLCAGIIEVSLGILLLAGFLTRFVGVIAFLVFSLSVFRFGESVLPHLLLMAIFICYFITGAQAPSVDRWLLQKQKRR